MKVQHDGHRPPVFQKGFWGGKYMPLSVGAGILFQKFEFCCSWCEMWRTHIHNRLVCWFIFVFHMHKIWSADVLVFRLIFLTITFFSPRFPLLLLGTDADDGAFFEELYLHKKEDFLS